MNILLPAIWLIVLIVGLPQLSETVYTPSLPDIGHALQTSPAMVEYTLTIYLLGFALGTLFWGKLSDRLGRKPCIIAGLIIFILGCVGCYYSSSIEMLMLSRLIQAFGGSIGSVLGQALCRDAFQGPALARVYSAVGSALALFPALGPVCGGLIAQHFGWKNIFVFLILFALVLTTLVFFKLPETLHKEKRNPVNILKLAIKMLADTKVIALGLIVAACNGILFSYFAEGSFFLIEGLGLSASQYGFSFIAVAMSTMIGGMVSRKLNTRYASKNIMGYGLVIITLAASLFSAIVIVHHTLEILSLQTMIATALLSQMTLSFGICMATSNALALALVDYKYAIGTASSLFGFFYYSLISLATLGMGSLHNGTLLPMPLYFLALSLFMLLVKKRYLK